MRRDSAVLRVGSGDGKSNGIRNGARYESNRLVPNWEKVEGFTTEATERTKKIGHRPKAKFTTDAEPPWASPGLRLFVASENVRFS